MDNVIQLKATAEPPDETTQLISFLRYEAVTGVEQIQASNGDGISLDSINALICAAVDIALNSDSKTRERASEWLGGVAERLGEEA
ncbi:MAG: hypothetical protein DBP02_02090 [gamma proteobacterium symbiont of Ctena orbiculata]|nr:MAG: hypothetical protein DBP02_02090 [gamma proteobacterium symbiont of Ctena orbiculata]